MSDNKVENQPSEWAQAKLAEWERNMAKVQEEHPEFNIDPENKWWIPLVELEERTVRVFLSYHTSYCSIEGDSERTKMANVYISRTPSTRKRAKSTIPGVSNSTRPSTIRRKSPRSARR
jgi:hypothetical protein